MAILSTGEELFVFNTQPVSYTGANYVYVADNEIGLTEDAVSAIEAVSGVSESVNYLEDCCQDVNLRLNNMQSNINNKLDTTAFSTVSGTFLTAHQSLDGYATTGYVDTTINNSITGKLDVTAFSNVSGNFGDMKTSYINYDENNAITGYAGSAFKAGLSPEQLELVNSIPGIYAMVTAISAAISAQWTLSAGIGIKLTNDESTKTTVIEVV